jgi:NADP-dependent 3-hydroxy acid dehydrogenase YdfG
MTTILKNKICVITGASSGLVKATAELLAEMGGLYYYGEQTKGKRRGSL